MSIISCFPVGSLAEGPFCDYLNVTVPKDHSDLLLSDLVGFLPSLGPYSEVDVGLFAFHDVLTGKVIGTVKARPRGKVLIVSASGGVIRIMRESGRFSEYLAILGSYPHRVSMLHATADYAVDSPPAVIGQVKLAAQSGGLSLTRKHLDPTQCVSLLGTNSDGYETGTVYLGNRANADVWAKIYDKRHERICRGFFDPGPLVRVEVAVQSGMGATLRDAFDPSALFFHFAGRSIVERPSTFVPWVSNGEGYALTSKPDVTAAQRIARMVEFSRDIGRIIDLAVSEFGEGAAGLIDREIRMRIRRSFSATP